MAGFGGARVLSFESRRAKEIAELIRKHGGIPVIAPSVREVETVNPEERTAIRGILAGGFQVIIFMTGVGARALIEAAEAFCSRAETVEALRRTHVVVRGPKPAAVMREAGIHKALFAPEPNTWREVIAVLDQNVAQVPLRNARVAVQEHGEPSLELYAALRERGAEVVPIQVYRWELPEDTGPLRAAIKEVAERNIAVVMIASSVQFAHALRVAQEMRLEREFRQGLENAVVVSIGPISSEKLRQHGVRVDLEPSHPKMGFLVKEAAEKSASRPVGVPHRS
jgi:uroporphyrinogen-III synthase